MLLLPETPLPTSHCRSHTSWPPLANVPPATLLGVVQVVAAADIVLVVMVLVVLVVVEVVVVVVHWTASNFDAPASSSNVRTSVCLGCHIEFPIS